MDQNNPERLQGFESQKDDDDNDEVEKHSESSGESSDTSDHDEQEQSHDEAEQAEEPAEDGTFNYENATKSQFDSEEESEPDSIQSKEEYESVEDEPEDIEPLTPEESYTVVEEFVGERSAEVRREAEAVEPDTSEEAAVLANAALLDEMRDQLAEQGEGNEGVLDAAFEKVASELGLETEIEADQETAQEEEAVPPDPNIVPPTPNVPTPPIPTPPPPGPPTPPIPPTPNIPIPQPGPGPGPNPNIYLPPLQPNLNIPPPPTPNRQAPPPADVFEPRRHSRAGDYLLGGIIGYMIGRRGGRKRTEKRLLPIQEKLEHEIKDLQFEVETREEKIRKLAAEKFVREPEAAPKLVEKLKEKVAAKEAARGRESSETVPVGLQDKILEKIPEKFQSKTHGIIREKLRGKTQELIQEKNVETNTEQAIEKSADNIEKKIEPAGDIKLGKFAVPSAEVMPERRKITEETGKKPRIALEVMTVPQLLEVVSSAEVKGVSVKAMFEAGRLNEFGLRRVAIEFLRGKHYEKVLSVYLLPDSAEVVNANLSPENVEVSSGRGTSFLNFTSRRSAGGQPANLSNGSAARNSEQPPTRSSFAPLQGISQRLRKQPKIYPSVIGMAAGVLLALVIIIYVLIRSI